MKTEILLVTPEMAVIDDNGFQYIAGNKIIAPETV